MSRQNQETGRGTGHVSDCCLSIPCQAGHWENIDIGTIIPRYYPTPTPYTTSTQGVK